MDNRFNSSAAVNLILNNSELKTNDSNLDMSLIYPNPDQPRKFFNVEKLKELAQSIAKHGLLEPIVVVKTDKGYMIIAGERRYKAHLINNSSSISVSIIDIEEYMIKEVELIENIQREDLTDFEIAISITALWNSGRYEMKQDLGFALGKRAAYISKALGLVDKLDDSIKEDLADNKSEIGLSVLEEVSRVEDKDIQKIVYEKVKTKVLKRDDIKKFVTGTKEKKEAPKTFPREKIKKIAFGSGTSNHIGTYIFADDGDFQGSLTITDGGEFVNLGKKEFKITIEEV